MTTPSPPQHPTDLTQASTTSSSRSRSHTNLADQTPSRNATAVDLQEGQHHQNKWTAAEEAPVKPLADYEARQEGAAGAEVKLSQKRKWFLLFIFSVAQVSFTLLLLVYFARREADGA